MRRPTKRIAPSVNKASRSLRIAAAAGIVWVLAACGSAPTRLTTQPTHSSALPGSATPGQATGAGDGGQTLAPTATPALAATPVPDALLIWWAAPLYPGDKPEQASAASSLRSQIDDYQALGGRTVTIRVKRAEGLGSIYQTLRSGSVAAPSVMPDLALMRRSDLIQAAAAKLIEPIDSRALAADDLYASALALGQVRGTQYGIPYALEVQHVVYRTTALASPPRTLDALLKIGQPYLFPAGPSNGANATIMAQYVAAGGRIVDDKGAPVLDREPLLVVLRYYEQALAAKVAGPQLLEYTDVAQYWSLFASGKSGIVETDSTTFLAQRSNLPNVGVLPLAQPAGTPITLLDGWMWTITTGDPARQAKALDMLAWLLRPDRQGRFTRGMGVLPSRRSALDTWGNDDYATFAATLLAQTAAPPPDMIPIIVSSAIQKAFEDVLSGRQTAEAAADTALLQAASPR